MGELQPAFPKPTKREKTPKPLRSRKPMRKAPPKRIAERVADRPYLAWLAQQACVVTGAFRGGGVVIELNHCGIKPGIALKCSDLETLPMERAVHAQWTEYSGRFKAWTRDQRREWADARIVEHLDRFVSWVPERLAELHDELLTYADALTDEEREIGADISKQILALKVCRDRAAAKRDDVVARIGAEA